MMYVMCTELLYIKKPVCKVYTGFSLLGGWGSPPPTKNLPIHPPPHHIFISSHQKSMQTNKKIRMEFLDVVIAPVPFFFNSYSFETQIMLILILIDVQYSQNAVFSLEKFSNRQNHSSSGYHHLLKK